MRAMRQMVEHTYRALGLPLIAGAQEDPFTNLDLDFDLFFQGPEAFGDEVSVSEALDNVAFETAHFDPTTGGFTVSRPFSAEVSDLTDAATRIAADPVLRELVVDDNGNIVFSDGRPADPGILSRVASFFGSAAGAVGDFLAASPNIARALASLGLGAAGLGLGRLIAGPGGTLKLPDSTAGQTPVVAAGQPALTSALAGSGGAALREAIEANLQGQRTLATAAVEDIQRAREAEAAIQAGSAPVRSLALQQLPAAMTGRAPHPSAAYDATSDAVLRQLEMIFGLPTGQLGTTKGPTVSATAPPGLPGGVSPAEWAAKLGALAIDPASGLGRHLADPANALEAYNYGVGPKPAPPGAPPPAPISGTLAGVTFDPNLAGMQRRLAQIIAGGPEAYAQADPIEAQMAARLERAIAGGELDPATERRIRDELEILRNNLKRAYGGTGAEWESTIGQNLYLKGLESAEALRYGVNRDIINTLGPQHVARRTFSIQNPQNMYLSALGFYGPQTAQRGQLPAAERRALLSQYLPQTAGSAAFNETARANTLAQTTALAGLNRPSLALGANALGAQWSTFGPLTGTGEPNTFPTLANATVRAFEADQAARAATARDVLGIFGRAAGELRGPPTFAFANMPERGTAFMPERGTAFFS